MSEKVPSTKLSFHEWKGAFYKAKPPWLNRCQMHEPPLAISHRLIHIHRGHIEEEWSETWCSLAKRPMNNIKAISSDRNTFLPTTRRTKIHIHVCFCVYGKEEMLRTFLGGICVLRMLPSLEAHEQATLHPEPDWDIWTHEEIQAKHLDSEQGLVKSYCLGTEKFPKSLAQKIVVHHFSPSLFLMVGQATREKQLYTHQTQENMFSEPHSECRSKPLYERQQNSISMYIC